MAKEKNTEAELRRDSLRTRRIEARRDMIQALPQVLEASAKVIDSIATSRNAHISGCGGRYAEVVLAEHQAGVTFMNRLLSIAEESGVVEAAAGAFKAACDASIANSKEEVRRADSIQYENVTCLPWTPASKPASEPASEPDTEPKPEPKPKPVTKPKPKPASMGGVAKLKR